VTELTPPPHVDPVDPNPHRARLSLDNVSGDVRNSSLYSVGSVSRRDREDNDAPSLPSLASSSHQSEPALSALILQDTADASEEELVEEWQRYKQLAAQVEQELRARQSARCVRAVGARVRSISSARYIRCWVWETDAARATGHTGRSTVR
jgi:hypothetical protein